MIKISVPNDDEAALQYFGEAMIKLAASVRGGGPVDVRVEPITLKLDDEALARLQQAMSDLMQAAPAMMRENDVDGSIEIHGKRKEEATHIITSEEKVGGPVDLGDGNFSQGYRIEVEELATTDSTNTPWDERIHSASKALNSDGTWRLRRKPKDMDEAEWSDYVSMIKADLEYPVECGGQEPDDKQKLIDETVAKLDALYEPEPPVTPPGDDFHVDAGVVTEQQVADIPPPPPVPVSSANAAYVKALEETYPEQSAMTFPQVMAYLTERHGRISNAQVEQIIAEMGLKSIMDLNTQAEYTGPFIARVKALLGE